MQSSGRRLLSSAEAAAVLHRSRETIARWARNGDLEVAERVPYGFGGGLYRFDADVVAKKALALGLARRHRNGATLFDDAEGDGDA